MLLIISLGSGPAPQDPAPSRYPASVAGAPPGVYADPEAAADSLQRLVERDSLDDGASWRLALALLDVGKRVPDDVKDRARDSLYAAAVVHARRAARLAPDRAEAHFALAAALGRASLTRGIRDRVRDAREIREAALRTLAIDSLHDGAWHVLGRWHGEVMALSRLERFFARHFLGAADFREASWEDATRHLERAVALRPTWIAHRLILADLYVQRRRFREAREQLHVIETLPPRDPLDPVYRRAAAALLQRIADKR